MLGSKVYYYPWNEIFHEAACHSEGNNKPDIQHSKSAILYLLRLYTKWLLRQVVYKMAFKTETMHSSKTTLVINKVTVYAT